MEIRDPRNKRNAEPEKSPSGCFPEFATRSRTLRDRNTKIATK